MTDQRAGSLLAGVGVRDITPTQPVRLAGFLAREPAVPPLDVHDPLEARVLALRSGDTTAVLVICDLIGMSTDISAALRLAVQQATGIPVERVLTACTHTHSGPDTLLGMDRYAAYELDLAAAVVGAIEEAVAGLVPVSIGHASLPLPRDLAVNRRGLAFDPSLVLLDLWHDGTRLASLTNVGIHPVTHGPDVHVVTADWVGHFRRSAEAALGGTALLLSGPLGDVNPPGGDGYDRAGGGPELAARVGDAVASLTAQAALHTTAAGTGLSAGYRTVELPVGDSAVAGLISAGRSPVLAELYEWQIGDVRLVSLPGEPLSAFGDAVVQSRPGPVLQAGLAPTWQGYLPHPDAFDPAGYEEGMSLGHAAVAALLEAVTCAR